MNFVNLVDLTKNKIIARSRLYPPHGDQVSCSFEMKKVPPGTYKIKPNGKLIYGWGAWESDAILNIPSDSHPEKINCKDAAQPCAIPTTAKTMVTIAGGSVVNFDLNVKLLDKPKPKH